MQSNNWALNINHLTAIYYNSRSRPRIWSKLVQVWGMTLQLSYTSSWHVSLTQHTRWRGKQFCTFQRKTSLLLWRGQPRTRNLLPDWRVSSLLYWWNKQLTYISMTYNFLQWEMWFILSCWIYSIFWRTSCNVIFRQLLKNVTFSLVLEYYWCKHLK